MRGIKLKDWRLYQDIITDSLWLFDERDSDEKLSFHGAFIPQVARQLIKRYTAENDNVVDLFAGSGTTFKECRKLKRNCLGVDLTLHPGLLQASESGIFIQGDSCSLEIVEKIQVAMPKVDLVIAHPPYHNIIKFSDHPDDLSNQSLGVFINKMSVLAAVCKRIVTTKGIVALVIGDIYLNSQTVPLGFLCMQHFMEFFKLKSIVVKNIENNEAKGRSENLWRYRAMAGGFSIFKHEYVITFQKY